MSKWNLKKIFKLTFKLEKDSIFSETVDNMMEADSWIVISTFDSKQHAYAGYHNIEIGKGEHERLLGVLKKCFDAEIQQEKTLDSFLEMLNYPNEPDSKV